MADIKDWSSLGKPNDEWETFVKENMDGNAPDLGLFPDIASMRKWIESAKQAMTAEMGGSIKGYKEHDEQVTMRDGHKITCRIHAAEKTPSGGSPLVVIYHGGGWCIGDLSNEELLCRLLASELGATTVNVDYRLGPEHRFPAAHNDCLDATKWAAENASKLGADPSKGFIIGGTSAGGNITAVVAHQFRDEKITPPLTGCLHMIPAVCNSEQYPEKYKKDLKSYYELEHAAILSHKAMHLFLSNYIDEKDRGSQLFSPLLWESGHKDLPPSVFQIAGQDPLRDEGLMYERILREDYGIKTKVEVYPGCPHGYHSVAPTLNVSKKFVQDAVKGVKWLLEQS